MSRGFQESILSVSGYVTWRQYSDLSHYCSKTTLIYRNRWRSNARQSWGIQQWAVGGVGGGGGGGEKKFF